MAETPIVASDRIVRNPRILDGEPTVRGTRVPVRSIVLTARYSCDLDCLRQAFPMLDDADIQAALAFYKVHQGEIDQLIEENERENTR